MLFDYILGTSKTMGFYNISWFTFQMESVTFEKNAVKNCPIKDYWTYVRLTFFESEIEKEIRYCYEVCSC